MFEKIEIFDKRYSELSERLYQPSVAGNPEEYQKIMKEIKSIEEIVLTYRKYKEAVQTEKDSLEILEETSDKECDRRFLKYAGRGGGSGRKASVYHDHRR